MSIDLRTETVLSLPQAVRRLPPGRGGKPMHVSTLVRAITKGTRGGHKLEGLRVGGRWLTSVEALQRWAERQTADLVDSETPRPSTVRSRSSERAGRELDERGF